MSIAELLSFSIFASLQVTPAGRFSTLSSMSALKLSRRNAITLIGMVSARRNKGVQSKASFASYWVMAEVAQRRRGGSREPPCGSTADKPNADQVGKY